MAAKPLMQGSRSAGRWRRLQVATGSTNWRAAAGGVMDQVGGGQPRTCGATETAAVDPLEAAPVEARAVFGVMQAPVELSAGEP